MIRYYHLFPFEKIPQGSHIIIYGAGEVGQWYLSQMRQTEYAEIVAVADKAWEEYPSLGAPLIAPEDIGRQKFDYVLISIEKSVVAREVANMLIQYFSIPEEKIVLGCESLCAVPNFLKAGYASPHFAYQPRGLAAAVLLWGGLGDCIIYKRKLEEILSWDKRLVIDCFVREQNMLEQLHSFLDGEMDGRINAIAYDPEGRAFEKHMKRYAFAMEMTIDLEIRAVNEENLVRDAPNLLDRCIRINEQCKAYGHIDVDRFAIHYARCIKEGYNCYSSYNRYDGFDIEDWHTHIPLRETWRQRFEELHLPDRYITMNYGFGKADEGNCKAWPLIRFAKLAILLKECFPRVAVIQVGGEGFPVIEGTDRQILGESLEIIKYVLRASMLHIDIEGGLVHLATQLGTRCAVLFGPTPLPYYSYPVNLNIQAGTCHDCYWYTKKFHKCYRQLVKPECMQAITPELVLEQVKGRFGEALKEGKESI